MKKLRYLIGRVKRWLIRKLGGYTYPVPTIQPPGSEKLILNELRGSYFIPYDKLCGLSEGELEAATWKEIGRDLAIKLMTSGAVSIWQTDGLSIGGTMLKWRLRYATSEEEKSECVI